MSFFDKVTKAVGDVVDRGKAELDQFKRIQKINGEIAEMDKTIAECRAQIQASTQQAGEKAIALARAGTIASPDLKELVDQIAGFEKQIAEQSAAVAGKRKEIEAIKAEDDAAEAKAADATAVPPLPAAPAAVQVLQRVRRVARRSRGVLPAVRSEAGVGRRAGPAWGAGPGLYTDALPGSSPAPPSSKGQRPPLSSDLDSWVSAVSAERIGCRLPLRADAEAGEILDASLALLFPHFAADRRADAARRAGRS